MCYCRIVYLFPTVPFFLCLFSTFLRFRVTKLAELWLFTLGSFPKICSKNVWATFVGCKRICNNLNKNELGHILGEFFTNSSCHPANHSQFCNPFTIFKLSSNPAEQMPALVHPLIPLSHVSVHLALQIRVTRLGEFSSNAWFLTFGSFMKIAETVHIFGLFFATVKAVH
jgi:hypothetical protein